MTETLSIAEAAAQFQPTGHYLNTASIGVPPRSCAENVAVSRRAGATRLSFHLYNTDDDALAAAAAVSRP